MPYMYNVCDRPLTSIYSISPSLTSRDTCAPQPHLQQLQLKPPQSPQLQSPQHHHAVQSQLQLHVLVFIPPEEPFAACDLVADSPRW
jgi:hypothetical protein